MARVTVEDCVKQIPNRFELVLEATKRARRLTSGAAQSVLEWENDKPTVLALREIAAGYRFNQEEVVEEDSEGGGKTTTTTKSVFGSHSAFTNI